MKYRSLTFGRVRRPQMVRPLMRTWKLPAPAKRFLGNAPPLERRHWLHCLKGQPWGERAPGIANARGISRRTLYRWLARYRDAATTSPLIPIARGTPLGAHRLDTAREALVNKIIEQEYLSRSPPTVEENFWAGFDGPDDRLKGNDSLEGTECH
jgi:hypothetical protein